MLPSFFQVRNWWLWTWNGYQPCLWFKRTDHIQDHHCYNEEKGGAFNSAHNHHKGLTNVIMDKAGAMPLSFLRKTCARTQYLPFAFCLSCLHNGVHLQSYRLVEAPMWVRIQTLIYRPLWRGAGPFSVIGSIAWALHHGPGLEEKAFRKMQGSCSKTQIIPNKNIIRHADDYLKRNRALSGILTQWSQKITWRRALG